jgi:hypothetical protein
MVTDPEAVLRLLKDPHVDSPQVAEAAGVTREDAARAARLVHGIARATAPDLAGLPAVLALAVLRAALAAGRADLLAAAAADRALAKEARRGLHLLRSRGVSTPEPARAPPPAAPEPAAEAPPPCYASSIDGRGERAAWIARNVPGKGVEVAQAVLSDLHGLVELHVAVLGRKEYRAFGRDVAARGRGLGILEVSRDRAHALVAEARRRNEASGRAPPEGADAWLARLGEAPPRPDPAARFPALPDAEEAAAVAESGRLHDLPVLRGWLAEEDALRALAQRLDEIAVSPLYLDGRQRFDQSLRVLADAVASYFDAPRRAQWAARLFAAAEHLELGGDALHAGLAAAAARALARGEDPARVPFARLLVEKAFPLAEPPPDEAARAESPLIVAPR